MEQTPALIKAIRKMKKSHVKKWGDKKELGKSKAIGAFRMEVIETLIYLMALDETSEILNLESVPETLVQIVLIWFFEDYKNQFLQKAFLQLAERILSRGHERAKISLCFKLGSIDMINMFTSKIYQNNLKIVYFDYEALVLSVRRLAQIIKEHAKNPEISRHLENSLAWKQTLYCFCLIEKPKFRLQRKVGALALALSLKDDTKTQALVSPVGRMQASRESQPSIVFTEPSEITRSSSKFVLSSKRAKSKEIKNKRSFGGSKLKVSPFSSFANSSKE
jgi:hypothetical protein